MSTSGARKFVEKPEELEEDGPGDGFVEQVGDVETLLAAAQARAAQLAPLAAHRENYGGQKRRLFGEHAAINDLHGAAYMLANPDQYGH